MKTHLYHFSKFLNMIRKFTKNIFFYLFCIFYKSIKNNKVKTNDFLIKNLSCAKKIMKFVFKHNEYIYLCFHFGNESPNFEKIELNTNRVYKY